MSRFPFANRFEEQQLFRQIIVQKRPEHLLFVSGKPGMGKTVLLRMFLEICEQANILTALFDFKISYEQSAMLAMICNQLGWDRFPELQEQRTALVARPDISPDISIKLGKPDLEIVETQLALGGLSLQDRWRHQFLLTEAFFNDLHAIVTTHPIVIFFDDFERALHETQAWFRDVFLPLAAKTSGVVIVVAGRDLLEPRLDWTSSLLQIQLKPISTKDWIEYARQSHVSLSREQIELISTQFAGDPLKIAMVFSMFTGTERES